jgi:HD-GYP domain-containing protein (c-di-GMP phosphodiesterase class II)
VLVVTGALCIFASSAFGAARDLRLAPSALLFAIAGAIAQSFYVALPTSRPGNPYTMTVGAAVGVAAILLFPLHWAVVIVTLALLVGRKGVWFKRVFNAGHLTLTAALAGFVWSLAGPDGSLVHISAVPLVLATVLAYFVCSSLLVSTMVAVASGLPVGLTWRRAHRHTWPATLGTLFTGVLVAVLWMTSPWTIALAAIPLTAIYYTLRNTVSLETQTVDALFQLADILDARDSYTHGHALRVGQYAETLALQMGLSGDDAHLIFLAGRLHDIGKCAIKNEVLLKPGALTDEERAHMSIHPEVGSSMLASFSLFTECARYVRGHHERWDGNGYPDQLAGENIPLGARIIAVADAFDAMTTTRPYRTALPISEAQRRLADGAGTQWDPQVIPAFLKLLETTSLGQPEPVQLSPDASPAEPLAA